jgi:ParB family transcriptional regulator, chromosome partitioning protein
MVTEVERQDEVQIIPIAAITVENPRERSEKTFRALVDSIGKVGLKSRLPSPGLTARQGKPGALSAVRGGWRPMPPLGKPTSRPSL